MKKTICITLVIIILALAGFGIYSRCTRIMLAFQDDAVGFDMTTWELLLRKGFPDEKSVYTATPFVDYDYKEKIEGYDAEVSYEFYDRAVLPDFLNGASVRIKIDDANEARALFDKLYQRVNDYYKTQKDYYCKEIEQISDAEYEVVLGTDDGAEGIYIKIGYNNKILYLDYTYTR